jgi:hypothetical protein
MTVDGQAGWHMPVILVTGEAEVGGSQFETSLGDSMRLYLTNKAKQKRKCWVWLKWYSGCLVLRPISGTKIRKKKRARF